MVVRRRARRVFAFADEIEEVELVGIMAEKRLVLRKTSGVLRKSCEVFYGQRGREGRDGTEGEIKGAD